MSYKNDVITEYLKVNGEKPIIVESNPFKLFLTVRARENTVVLSDNKIIRGLCRLLGIKKRPISGLFEMAEMHLTMVDALEILAAKQIPVFFYNRIGIKKDYSYSQEALCRIKNEIDFIKMSEDRIKYGDLLAKIIGHDYSDDYIDKLSKIPQVIHKGNLYCHEDCKTELVNVVDGRRITVPTNSEAKRIIHIYGRCGAFGYAVSDSENLPSRLQQKLITGGHKEFKVINHGIWGGEDSYILNNFFYELSEFKKGDIVIFYMRHFEEPMINSYKNINMYYKDITAMWHQMIEGNECFYDKPGHMNKYGYEYVAEIIYKDLEAVGFADDIQVSAPKDLNAKYLNVYLKNHSNLDFKNEINKYITELRNQNPELKESTVLSGSIVMNCNPFTKGHRYLIEYAASRVDRLIIFVVEEDKSFFRFEDRYEMVRKGTSDLHNVFVVPSGKFIISTITFPEYFLKDYVKEKNFDLSQDLNTFCKYIATELNISIRFAGEEPLDPVTANYNENMRRILPENGIRFEEIPRMKINGTEKVINATDVRQLISEKKIDVLRDYIPETTLAIIEKKYL